MSQVLSCPFLVAVTLVLPGPESQGLPRWPGPATSLQWKARQLGRGSQAVSLGTGLSRGNGEGGGGGEAPGKPAVTALTLISQLQSRPEREPARVCALLTQAGKTFLS